MARGAGRRDVAGGGDQQRAPGPFPLRPSAGAARTGQVSPAAGGSGPRLMAALGPGREVDCSSGRGGPADSGLQDPTHSPGVRAGEGGVGGGGQGGWSTWSGWRRRHVAGGPARTASERSPVAGRPDQRAAARTASPAPALPPLTPGSPLRRPGPRARASPVTLRVPGTPMSPTPRGVPRPTTCSGPEAPPPKPRPSRLRPGRGRAPSHRGCAEGPRPAARPRPAPRPPPGGRGRDRKWRRRRGLARRRRDWRARRRAEGPCRRAGRGARTGGGGSCARCGAWSWTRRRPGPRPGPRPRRPSPRAAALRSPCPIRRPPEPPAARAPKPWSRGTAESQAPQGPSPRSRRLQPPGEPRAGQGAGRGRDRAHGRGAARPPRPDPRLFAGAGGSGIPSQRCPGGAGAAGGPPPGPANPGRTRARPRGRRGGACHGRGTGPGSGRGRRRLPGRGCTMRTRATRRAACVRLSGSLKRGPRAGQPLGRPVRQAGSSHPGSLCRHRAPGPERACTARPGVWGRSSSSSAVRYRASRAAPGDLWPRFARRETWTFFEVYRRLTARAPAPAPKAWSPGAARTAPRTAHPPRGPCAPRSVRMGRGVAGRCFESNQPPRSFGEDSDRGACPWETLLAGAVGGRPGQCLHLWSRWALGARGASSLVRVVAF